METGTVAERHELTPDELVQKYFEYKRQRVHGRSLATANWVTTLAHDCEAYAVFMRTVPPEDRRGMKDSLGMIFSEGDDQARAIKRDLIDMGFEVSSEEGQVAWPKYQITGRRDLKLLKPGTRKRVPVEVKSCSPFTYDSIDSVADIREHKWSFIQKWDKQVALYMVLDSQPEYWLLLKNKSSGQIKIIQYTLGDEEYRIAEVMLKKAEKTNHLVQIGQMPTPAMKLNDPDVCGECEFFPVCVPDLDFGLGARVLTDEAAGEMSMKLDRHAVLKPMAKEFEDLDDELKTEVKTLCSDGTADVVVGDWMAHVKRIPIKASTPKPRAAYTQERVTFIKSNSVQVSPAADRPLPSGTAGA